jgi:hypothetical protein
MWCLVLHDGRVVVDIHVGEGVAPQSEPSNSESQLL